MATRKITPDEDLMQFNEIRAFGEVFRLRRKFKIGRFLKTLNDDPVEALSFVLDEDSFERFLDVESDMGEFQTFLEKVANTMSGGSLGN